MANDKNFKVKNGLQAGRYLHQTAGLSDPYDGVTIRPVFHYDMIANVFTADLQLDDISFAGELYTSSGLEPWDTTIVDTSISNYSSASWFPVNTGSIAGRVNRDSGGTPSTGTGRTDSVSNTFYFYFETTSPANTSNYDFLLRGEEQELSAAPTFSFYEARNGTSLGNLNVYVDVVESPWDSIPVGLTSQLLQTTGDVDAWVQKTVPMDMFYRPPGSKVVDLKIANHFTHTLTGDTTLYFENPPESGNAGSFALEVTGADVTVGYDLASTAYDSVGFSVQSQDTSPTGLFFKPDGTKMYISGDAGNDITEYDLSTAWDVSTSTYNQAFSVSTQESSIRDVFFKPDGTKMYIVGSNGDDINEYNLSTAWDVSTSVYSQSSSAYDGPYTETSPTGIHFKPDGTKVYVVGKGLDRIYESSLSTAWDISTITYVTQEYINPQETGPDSIHLNPEGTKLYIIGTSGRNVDEYVLSTAFDLDTATFSVAHSTIEAQETNPQGMAFKDDGTKMYIVGTTTDTVYQYSTSSSTPATITYPSSVKWPGGTTPDAPAAGEKDIYTFVTTDGGTTYYGKQAGDAIA